MNNITYFLLVLFGGWLGLHKFVQKNIKMGILYLLTFGLFGIGWFIDIMIALSKLTFKNAPKRSDTIPATHTPQKVSVTKDSEPTVKVSNVNFKHINKYKECFIAFDLETTGIKASDNRIIEISAIIYRNFVPCETFSSLVNPQMHIPSSASKVNHIYDKDVADAPTESDCMKTFCNFIGLQALSGNIPLVAHNASFDAKFLSYALNRCEIKNEIVYLDTLRLSRKSELGLENYKLGTLATHFGIKQHSAHRAEDDARVCGEIFVKLLQLQQTK